MPRANAHLAALALAAASLTAGPAREVGSSVSAAAPPVTASFRFPPVAGADTTGASISSPASLAPIGLSASDGTGLELVAFQIDGLLEPPLAFTELRLTFENPRDSVLEGRFRIALPPGAAISRFAMKIGGAWQEGEVVERQRARVAYEDFLHRRQDPALLEQEAGNEFSARVFPIPARGRKEMIVSYSHSLPRSDSPYLLPLRGLARIGQLDARILLGSRPVAAGKETSSGASSLGGSLTDRRVVELHKRDWTPDQDLEIRPDQAGGAFARPGPAALRQGNLALVRVEAPAGREVQEIRGLTVLIDSSASRALGYEAQVRLLGDLLAGLRAGAGSSTPLAVAVFDQEVLPIYEGPAGGFGPRELEALNRRRPLGASDLEGALRWLGTHLPAKGQANPRVLLLTDGVATAGKRETRDLKAAVKALGERGVERLDVLAVGGLRDDAVLRELVTGNLRHDGQRIEGSAPLAEIGRRLTLACRSGLTVEVEGAEWLWPEQLDGMQPGDEALVYADLPEGKPLRLRLDGKAVAAAEAAPVERALLERAWAQARIERLVHLRDGALGGDPDLRRALEHQIVEVSEKHRVLSPLTALLVLETEADYQRFGLERRGLADILTVGSGGLEVLARSQAPLPEVAVNLALVTKRQARPQERRNELEPSGVPGPLDGRADALADSQGEAPEGMEQGVEGGVAGGVVGGVPGGVAGGTVGAPPPAPRAMPAPSVQAVEVPADAPLRVGGRDGVPVDETILIEARRPLLDARRAPTDAATRPGEADGEGERADAVSAADDDQEEGEDPYTGRFAEVMNGLKVGRLAAARTLAESWSREAPGDVLALLALGEVWEAAGEKLAAARAYGSLIDLFPSRADLRRLAGERLERLGEAGLPLAVDSYRAAVEQRPDHPTGHRLLAWALLRVGQVPEAFAALEKGLEQKYPGGRFNGADRVLREDLGLLGAAWLRAEPDRRPEVLERLRARGAKLETGPSVRFVLTWETDANDVDFHVYDRHGAHAYYDNKSLASGGELYADVTTGYGPECFTVRDPGTKGAAPYRLAAHYYSRGPMGYGMGTVQIVAHDGNGRLKVEPRPFVVMVDQAMVQLGSFGEGPASAPKKKR